MQHLKTLAISAVGTLIVVAIASRIAPVRKIVFNTAA